MRSCVSGINFRCSFTINFRKSETLQKPKKIQKSRTLRYSKVCLNFPKMRTPFASCKPFNNSQVLKPLQLTFQREEARSDLQELRVLLTRVQDQLNVQIRKFDSSDAVHLSPLKRNVFIKQGKARSDGGGRYPSFVTLKVDPATSTFATPDGTFVNVSDIDLRHYELEPTVHVRDVWRVGDTYYPRLFVDRCVVHQLSQAKNTDKKVPKTTFDADESESEDLAELSESDSDDLSDAE